jgi:mannose-6-phosphate isomerase class I
VYYFHDRSAKQYKIVLKLLDANASQLHPDKNGALLSNQLTTVNNLQLKENNYPQCK